MHELSADQLRAEKDQSIKSTMASIDTHIPGIAGSHHHHPLVHQSLWMHRLDIDDGLPGPRSTTLGNSFDGYDEERGPTRILPHQNLIEWALPTLARRLKPHLHLNCQNHSIAAYQDGPRDIPSHGANGFLPCGVPLNVPSSMWMLTLIRGTGSPVVFTDFLACIVALRLGFRDGFYHH